MLSQKTYFTKQFTKTASALPIELFVELKKKKMTSSKALPNGTECGVLPNHLEAIIPSG